MRKSGPGRWWGPHQGSGVSEREGTSWKGRGLTVLQGSEICRASPRGGLTPPPPPCHPRPPTAAQAPTQPASALLVLALGRDRGPRGELSPSPLAARPPPRLLPRPGEHPHPCHTPSLAVSLLGQNGGAPVLVCLGLWEVGSQGRSRGQRSHQPPTPAPAPMLRDPSGSIVWAEASRTRPHPPLCGKLIPIPLCLSFPLGKRMRLRNLWSGLKQCALVGGGSWPAFLGLGPPPLLPSTSWPERHWMLE